MKKILVYPDGAALDPEPTPGLRIEIEIAGRKPTAAVEATKKNMEKYFPKKK